jgi:hypothetical protein
MSLFVIKKEKDQVVITSKGIEASYFSTLNAVVSRSTRFVTFDNKLVNEPIFLPLEINQNFKN